MTQTLLCPMQKRSLSDTLTTPISDCPSLHFRSWCMPPPLPPSLLVLSQTPHCIPLLMPVLRLCVPRTLRSGLMLPHQPEGLKRSHCSGRSHAVALWLLVRRHTSLTGAQRRGPLEWWGRGCHGDSMPTLFSYHSCRGFFECEQKTVWCIKPL